MTLKWAWIYKYCDILDDCSIKKGLIYQIKGTDPSNHLFAYYAGAHTKFNSGHTIPTGTNFFVMSTESSQSCYSYTNSAWNNYGNINFFDPPYSAGTIIEERDRDAFPLATSTDPDVFTKPYDDSYFHVWGLRHSDVQVCDNPLTLYSLTSNDFDSVLSIGPPDGTVTMPSPAISPADFFTNYV
jgi:hypothetical protein